EWRGRLPHHPAGLDDAGDERVGLSPPTEREAGVGEYSGGVDVVGRSNRLRHRRSGRRRLCAEAGGSRRPDRNSSTSLRVRGDGELGGICSTTRRSDGEPTGSTGRAVRAARVAGNRRHGGGLQGPLLGTGGLSADGRGEANSSGQRAG